MSKAFSAFYDDLLPDLPGCTTGMLDLQLLRTAREFCERSSAWRGAMLTIAHEAGTKTYTLFSPEPKSEIVRVLELRVAGKLLWRAEAVPDASCEQPCFEAGDPPFSLDAQASEITFFREPTGDIDGVACMRPVLTSTSLPDVMQTRYLEALRCGVFARLMAMAGKPWTNAGLASYYEQCWRQALNFHAVRAARGNTRAPLRTRKWG